jgi:Na+/H+-dicarboxylate symporter
MPQRRPWYTVLYLQVLLAIGLGILVGHFFPNLGIALKPLGDGYVALIKMMIAPVVFCIVVQGIASMSDLKKVGRVGVKALVYFELVSTFALVIGILVAQFVQPGKASISILQPSIPKPYPGSSDTPGNWESFPGLRPSSRAPLSMLSLAATCSRCSFSRSFPASPFLLWANWASA